MNEKLHPTRQRLIDSTLALLASHHPDSLSVEMVLTHSGVSKGSLYHHFEDFQDLVEDALVVLFVDSVDSNAQAIQDVVHNSPDKPTFLDGLARVTRETQSDETRAVRFRRTRMLALSEGRPRLMRKMTLEQARLTQGYESLFRESQAKGWLNNDFDPRAAAVFIQAYTIGKIVDDVTTEPMDQAAWDSLIMKIVFNVFC